LSFAVGNSRLVRDIDVHTGLSEIGWITSSVLDLLQDDSTVQVEADPPSGPLPVASVFDHWLAHDIGYRSTRPRFAYVTKSLSRRAGGPASEDTGLVIASSVIGAGYFISEPNMLYRIWPGRRPASRNTSTPNERAAHATHRPEPISRHQPSICPGHDAPGGPAFATVSLEPSYHRCCPACECGADDAANKDLDALVYGICGATRARLDRNAAGRCQRRHRASQGGGQSAQQRPPG
jgi:hypothetical protein